MIEWNEVLTRLGLAILFGGLVGFERERKDWAVGIRTHMMACLGSALVMMVSAFGFSDVMGLPNVSLDPSRVASSVVIGIGYLGAGIILVLKPGNIKGVTTASALWSTAGIGLACGGGLYFMAGVATIFIIGILYGIQIVQRKMALTTVRHVCGIEVADDSQVNGIVTKLMEFPIRLSGLAIKKKKGGCLIKAVVITSGAVSPADLLRELRAMPQVKKVFFK